MYLNLSLEGSFVLKSNIIQFCYFKIHVGNLNQYKNVENRFSRDSTIMNNYLHLRMLTGAILDFL